MSKVNDGGPAFPVGDMRPYEASFGMTLRDYFAATADISSVSFPTAELAAEFAGEPEPTDTFSLMLVGAKAMAKVRYMMADAMLAARNAPTE